MSKVELAKPILIAFYGYPGSGKTYVSRNLTEVIKAAHVNGDRIRNELFQTPRFDAQENAIVSHLMTFMTEEFLNAGISVCYDANTIKTGQRRKLKELAKKHKADYLLVWLQIDADSSFVRTQNRDRRTYDDRYAQNHSRQSYDQVLSTMQNPQDEEYLVISGKHTFSTQKGAILSRMYQLGLVSGETVKSNVAMPELVNLVPNPISGRVDLSRRNIQIR